MFRMLLSIGCCRIRPESGPPPYSRQSRGETDTVDGKFLKKLPISPVQPGENVIATHAGQV